MRFVCILINLLALCDSTAISDEIASYFVQSGKDHNLTCNSSADLSSFNLIKWYKNRKPIAYLNNQSIINLNSKFQQRSLILQGKDLFIQNITKNDSGFYKCIIDQENKISISNIQLMVLDKPSIPSVPKVESVTSRSVKIIWTTADALIDTQGPDALTFQIEYKEGKLSEKWVATPFGVNQTRAEVTGLKPYTRYAFRILATNGIGQSDPSPASDPIVTALEKPSESVSDMKIDRIGHDFIAISWRPPSPLSLNGPLLGYRLNVTPLNPYDNGNKVGRQAIWDGITNSILKTASHNHENLTSNLAPVNSIFGPHPSTHNIGRAGRIPLTTVRISDLKAFNPYHLTVEPFNGLYYGPLSPGPGPICTAPDKPLRSFPLNGRRHLAIRNISPDGAKLSLTWRSLDDLAVTRGPIIGYKLALKSYESLQGVRIYEIEKVDNDTVKETFLEARLHFELENGTAIYSTWVDIKAPTGWLNASCLGDYRKSERKQPWNVKIINLKPLSNYSFSLIAYNQGGDGPQSEPLFHATDTKVPGPPLNLTVRHLSSSLGEEDKEKGVPLSPPLLISWAPPAPSLTPSGSSEAGIARYLVEIYESSPPTPGSGIRNRRVEVGLRRPVNTFTVVPDRRNVTQTADSNLHVLVSGVRGRADYDIRVAAEVPSKLHPNRSLVGPYISIRHSYLMDGRESLKYPGYSLFGSESDQKPATKYGLAPGDIAKMGLIAGISVSAIFFILGIVMLFTWKRYYTRQKYSFLPYVMSTPPRQTGCAETCMSSAPQENQAPEGICVGKDLAERLNSDCTLIPSPHGLSKQNAPHRRSSRCRQKCHSSRRHKSIPADFKAKSGPHHARSPSLVTPLISLLQSSVSRHLGRLRRHVVAKGPPPEIRVRKCRRSKGHHSSPAPSAQAHYPYSALALDKSNKNRRSDWLAMIENSDYNHMAPVGIKDWPLYNDLMHAHSDQGFSDQFAQLCRNSATLLLPENNVASNLAANRRKNRYANIFAHDPTRVILLNRGRPARVLSPARPPLGAEPTHNDYINANFIKGYENPRAYIATQGPLTSSISDFWSMIWDYDIHSVIMITNLVERGKVKCDLYWPPEVGTLEKYGDVEVRHLSTEKRAYFTVRTFAVSSPRPSTPSHENSLTSEATIEHGRCSGLDDGNCNLTVAHQQLLQQQRAPKAFFASPDPRDSFLGCTINDTLSPTARHSQQQREDNHGVMFGQRIVIQYHYTQWPDHGVPRFTLPLLSFIRRCGHAKYITSYKMSMGEVVSSSVCRIESIKGDKRGNLREIKSQDIGHPRLTMCNVGGTSIIPSPETHIIGQSPEYNQQTAESPLPLVVHCSAGVGRTGTFFVIDVMLQRMAQRGTLDVYNYLAEIRQQRNYLVQTEEQFIFIHDALTMALAIGNSTLLSATSLEALLEAYFNRTPSTSDAKPKLLSIASDPHIIIGEGKETALKVKKNNLDPPKADWSASAEAIIKGPVRQAKAKVLSIFSLESRPKSASGLYYAPPTTSIPSPSTRVVKLPEPDPLSLHASLIMACHKELSPLSLTSPVCSNALKPCNRLKNRCSNPPCGHEQSATLNNADQQRKGEACVNVGRSGTKTGQHCQSLPSGPVILPSDDWRVPLTPKPTLEGSDYMNASYLEGFYSQKDFIVTQHPTLDTVHNFWQMIWENNCTDIFLLIFPKDTDSDAYLPFWPALESYLSFDCIKVFCLDSKSRNNLDAQSDGLFSIINFSLESDDEDYQLLTKMYICNGDLLPRYLSPSATPGSRIAECENIFHLARGSSALGDVLACRNLNKFVAALVNVLMRKNKPPLNALSQNLSPVVVIDKFGGFEAAALCILSSAYLQYLHDGGHFDLFQMAYIYNTKRPNLFSTQADVVALYTAMAGIITSKVTPTLPSDTSNPNTLSITPTLDVYHDDLNKTQLSFNTHNEYVTKMGEKISC